MYRRARPRWPQADFEKTSASYFSRARFQLRQNRHGPHFLDEVLYGVAGQLTFPHDNDAPTKLGQGSLLSFIAEAVSFELRKPEIQT